LSAHANAARTAIELVEINAHIVTMRNLSARCNGGIVNARVVNAWIVNAWIVNA